MVMAEEPEAGEIRTAPFEILQSDYNALFTARSRAIKGMLAHVIIAIVVLLNLGYSGWLLAIWPGALMTAPYFYWINALVAIVILAISYVLRPFILNRQYDQLALADRLTEMQFDKDGLSTQRDGTRTDVPWKNLTGYSDGPDHFFFWLNRQQGLVLPKRSLTGDRDADQLRDWLAGWDIPAGGPHHKRNMKRKN